MAIRDRLRELREQTLEDLKELRGISCLLNLDNSLSLNYLQALQEEISTTPSPAQLRAFSNGIRSRVEEYRKNFDVIASREAILTLFDHLIKETPPGEVVYVRKHTLSQLTAFYDSFVKLPPHAWIAVDVHGTHGLTEELYKSRPSRVLYQLLEERHYSDMCVLFNMAATLDATNQQDPQAVPSRSVSALCRATINAASHFVEAYINGIAQAHLLKHDGKLDLKAKETLTEWDLTQNRQKYLTLQYKVLNYPRIVTGASQPLLHEKNCNEFRLFFKLVKRVRDAIAHSSAAFDEKSGLPEKELRFDVELKHAVVAVDNAVALTQKIETLLKGNLDEVQWLRSRPSGDSLFPEDSYRDRGGSIAGSNLLVSSPGSPATE